MLKQAYNRESIAKVINRQDVKKWKLWNDKNEQEIKTEQLAQTLREKELKVAPFYSSKHRGATTYQVSSPEDLFSIRLLDKYLRRIYKVKQSDRSQIIKQIKTLLRDNSNLSVLRIDIKKCYESIPRLKLLKKVETDMVLSPQSRKLLKSIFDQCERQEIEGLPRGLSVSPTLSELYLEDLDDKIRKNKAVIYSQRYVDDYLIIYDSYKKDKLNYFINKEVEEIDLRINEGSDKFINQSVKDIEFTFLGYLFKVNHRNNNENKVSVTISKDKLKKIKLKIILALLDFNKNRNFSLLSQRINYLSTVRAARKHENGVLLSGLRYNYRHVTDEFECLKGIDGFYLKLISKSRFNFSRDEYENLKKKSFYGHTSKKIKSEFTNKKVIDITRIWKDV
ncbi:MULTISPECIES: antiviral reverse transcriptase Drt3a [Idiomarina]|jgi:hypothetical protein|uniref:antiviral reverse transcriptase Drt3a n=1 Tax=Idiomarina TaxID=135575 RepID=UPI000C0B5BFE|nr:MULTISPECIES: antiviral reverse transcriptase Drt3a [Idiomarina]MAC32333.1 hypothetical protein [Haliea sp.]MAO69229.1 hypothetical protein [Idiomarina sp.]MCJ8316603.1 RNA-directed DNA polymerase [Idiomarina sp.]NQZ15328.1 RNA-directed DNA polymerase [Idiomarina sp.]|tara:strand:- start:3768 stop:4946 length:1179 start_codon:yes stop_codon:yes gene_type:complete